MFFELALQLRSRHMQSSFYSILKWSKIVTIAKIMTFIYFFERK